MEEEVKNYKQYVVVEFRNGPDVLFLFTSDKSITIEAITRYLENNEGYNWLTDSATLVDEPTEIKLW